MTCGRDLLRDDNAARNGLKWTLEKRKDLLPGSGHLGEISSRCTIKFNGLGIDVVNAGVY